ncbi:MAG: lactonase family protein, partial [Planctomycetota bacterium]
NYLSNDISVFTIDGSTGALTAGTAVAAGFVNPGYGPHWVTVNPSRQSAYSANYNSNTIFQYSIDSGTGALTPLSSPWVVTGHQPTAIAVDPSGKNAYVTQDSGSLVGDPGTINVYSINGGTGALTFSTTINTGSRPFGIDIHPTGNFAYVANMGADEITVYAIDNVTGMLSTVDTYSCAGTGPMFVVVDPTGSFAYVANYYSNTVAAFAIDQSTGEMTLVVSPVPSGILPRMLAISGEIP